MGSQAQYRKGCARTLVLKILSDRQGTLYPLLYSLEKKGLICVDRETRDEKNGRKRLYYKLTSRGAESFAEDLATWSDIVKGMTLVLRGSTC